MIRKTIARYIDGFLLKRRRPVAEKVLLQAIGIARPAWMKRRRAYLSDLSVRRRVAIISPSDHVIDEYRRLLWGDTWAKYELTKALGEMGYLVCDIEPDVVIHLYGGSVRLPSSAYKILWIYSHPDTVDVDLLRRYDRIFCLSRSFVRKVHQMGIEAELMWGATSKRPRTSDISYDVVFVGNARGNGRRQIVDDVGTPDYRFSVWGRNYRYLPRRYWAGEYIDYTSLSDLYSSSLIALNDHQPEMVAEGFVAIRVFDILASGGFCISDANPGINEIFGDTVPQYRSANELRELVHFYIQNPDERLELMDRGREIALSHSWSERARQFMRGIDATVGEH